MGRLGLETTFVDGHRVTDEATMEVAGMVLVGKVNSEIVGLINSHGGTAVGLSGQDGRLIKAEVKEHHDLDGNLLDLGYVGSVKSIDTSMLDILTDDMIPVIASVGADDDGQVYNINADTVAGELAAALGAEKIVFLTDVGGILQEDALRPEPGQRVRPGVRGFAPGRRQDQRRHAAQGRGRAPRPRGRRQERSHRRRPRRARGPPRSADRRRLRHQDHPVRVGRRRMRRIVDGAGDSARGRRPGTSAAMSGVSDVRQSMYSMQATSAFRGR